MNFREQLAKGREVEVRVAEALVVDGRRHLLMASDYSGPNGEKAPALFSGNGRPGKVVPDFLVCDTLKSFWNECKGYDSAVYFRAAREWRHGIVENNFADYQSVECVSRIPVYLSIFERSTDKILVGLLTRLALRLSRGVGKSRATYGKPMVFFPRSAFQWRLSELTGDVYRPEGGELVHEHDLLERWEKLRYPDRAKWDMSAPPAEAGLFGPQP